MRILDIIDLKDYDENFIIDERYASRAIIIKNDNVMMVHSNLGEYKFPGGGIEPNESPVEALIREVREETGLIVLKESIREYGEIIEKRKSSMLSNTIFVHHSYYYLCNVADERYEQILDDYEKNEGFCLVEINPNEAYEYNKKSSIKHTLRENKVLELLINEDWECINSDLTIEKSLLIEI